MWAYGESSALVPGIATRTSAGSLAGRSVRFRTPGAAARLVDRLVAWAVSPGTPGTGFEISGQSEARGYVRAGRSLRRSHAGPGAAVDRTGHPLPGARHRRQRHDVQRRALDARPAAAVPRSRSARGSLVDAAHRGRRSIADVVSRLPRLAAPGDLLRRARGRPGPQPDADRPRRSRARHGRCGERGPVPHARRRPGARPRDRRERRPAGRRSGGRPHRSALAAPLQGRSEHRRPGHPHQRPAPYRRRRAPGRREVPVPADGVRRAGAARARRAPRRARSAALRPAQGRA